MPRATEGQRARRLTSDFLYVRLVGNHAFREKAIPRPIERLVPAEEVQVQRFAGTPGGERVIGIGRKKQVAIMGDEQRPRGSRIVVRAREPDDDEAYALTVQPLDQALEPVHRAQRARA